MNTGQVGGSEPIKPETPIGKELEKSGGGNIEDLLHAKVRTLGDLKRVLIEHLGEKKGTKFYNEFVKNIAMMMMEQMQQSADHLRQAEDEQRAMGP